jgi:electron transfer flavoprotein alpha subunit
MDDADIQIFATWFHNDRELAGGGTPTERYAARTDLPMVANCTAARLVDGGWELTRHRWGGVLLEDAHLDAEVALVTVVPHTVEATPADVERAAEVVPFVPALDEGLTVTRVRDRVTRTTGVSLATAPTTGPAMRRQVSRWAVGW